MTVFSRLRFMLPCFCVLAIGWPWVQDMAEQPSVGPLESRYPVPAGTLSHEGRSRVSDRMEAHEKLRGPMISGAESVDRGRGLFGIYCTPCHGHSGKGDGPVAAKFIPPPPLFPLVDSRSDGYLYGTVRFGGPIMPAYGEVLRDEEIWDIIVYLRAESAKLSGE